MVQLLSPISYSMVSFVIVLISIYQQMVNIRNHHEFQIKTWLTDNHFEWDLNFMQKYGCVTLLNCVKVLSNYKSNDQKDNIRGSEKFRNLVDLAVNYKNEKIVEKWFENNKLPKTLINNLKSKYKFESLLDLSTLHWTEQNEKLIGEEPYKELLKYSLDGLPNDSISLEALIDDIWTDIDEDDRMPWNWEQMIITSLFVAIIVGIATMASNLFITPKCGFLSFVTGNFLAPQNCRVKWEWNNPTMVGNSVSFTIKFFQRNNRSYPISTEDNLLVEITQGSHIIPCSVELGDKDPRNANRARVQFSAKKSGSYTISVFIGPNMTPIRGSPFTHIKFLPSMPSPQETRFINHCSTVICSEKIPHALFIEMRDKYGNLCIIEQNFDASDEFSVDLIEISTGKPIHTSFYWDIQSNISRIALVLKLEREGLYRATVGYHGSLLKNGDFNVIVLNSSDAALVEKHTSKKSHNLSFSAKLLCVNNERLNKPKKVFCYISPKQLTIKEYILKIIPKRLATFRLCPSTKFQFQKSENHSSSHENSDTSHQFLVIDDGCQPPVELLSGERNVIAATFAQFLLNNIGGSETFKDKQDFFYSEIRKYHQKYFHERFQVRIDRQRLLESSLKVTKGFSVGDWCKNFEIHFIGEIGLDWGGLRREWFELLSNAMFDPHHSDLFHRFKNDKQGLVHPNPKSQLKLKYYEFAGKIVGKCLYETSLGSCYRQLIKARFSRSFLAQLIGLRVHYKYFEQDDPDLYVSKIKYVLENDVEEMELYFTEEEYDISNGKLIRTIELIPNGSKIQVTNSNKLRYLDALAQYRLSTTVKDQVEYFLKGLNDLIPDNLLCIFDENELELLMCGAGSYSISEFKAYHAVSGANYEFRKILDWFWTAISNFTDEEMARLLQFTTGCSQLPPGGFAELNPKFHITSAPTFGNLPTAHTCFNQLCLPDYDSYDQFERALRLAINEGSEGFGII